MQRQISSIYISIPSILCSTVPSGSDDLIAKADEFGMPAVALTDHGNMFGAIEFYTEVQGGGHQADHRLRGLCCPRLPFCQRDRNSHEPAPTTT